MLMLPHAALACLGIGIAMEAIYVGAFVVPFPLFVYYHRDIDMAGIMRHSDFGFGLFMGSFVCLFALLGVAWYSCLHDSRIETELEVQGAHPSQDAAASLSSSGQQRRLLWIILGFGAVFGITLTFVYPVTAIDIFTYVAQSRILVHYHQNPIFVAPARFPHDSIMALTGGWAGTGAPYGPLGILVDATPALVASGSLLLNLILLKLFFSALVLAEAVVAYRIAMRVAPVAGVVAALLVAWNPLILFETSVNGHNDIVMVLLASLGILALVEGDHVIGLGLIGASALIKFATVPFIGLALVFVLTRPGKWSVKVRDLTLGLVLIAFLTTALYIPFWEGPSTLNRALLENTFHFQSFDSSIAWAFPGLTLNAATLLGRILFVPIYAYAMWLATKQPQDFVRACFLTLFAILGLAISNVKIWYLMWPACIAACLRGVPGVAGLLSALGATLSAALFAYVYLWLGPAGFSTVNAIAFIMTFAPAAFVLIIASVVPRMRRLTSRTRTPSPVGSGGG